MSKSIHDRSTVSRSDGMRSSCVCFPFSPSDHWSPRPIFSSARSIIRQSRFHFPWWYPHETPTNAIEQIFGTGVQIALNIIMDRSKELPGREWCHLPQQPCQHQCQWTRSQRQTLLSRANTAQTHKNHLLTHKFLHLYWMVLWSFKQNNGSTHWHWFCLYKWMGIVGSVEESKSQVWNDMRVIK